MSFNVEQQIARPGRIKRLFELLMIRHHADADPAGRARREIERMLEAAFAHFATHFSDAKSAALRALIDLQKEALGFYEHVLGSRGTPDVARLERILREMDEEMSKLSRDAGEIADSAPRFTPPGLSSRPPKTWDDPTLDFDEFAAAYRARYPNSHLSDPRNAAKLRKFYDAGERLNPATGQLKQPVRPLAPPTHIDLPTDPAKIKAWQDFQRGGAAPPCFLAGTLIHTPAGQIPIERIAAGDQVFAWNEDTRAVTTRTVLRTYRNWTTEVVAVTTARGAIDATRSHRFWTDDRARWTAAAELAVGAALRTRDGGTAEVIAIDRLAARSATYNLEIAEDHTYFVAAAGLLVHNEDDSAFVSRDARYTEIYVVRDKNTNKVVYVGQSVQGVDDRLVQHINDPDSALYVPRPEGTERLKVNDPANPYRSTSIAEGTWTPYEAAVWEQYFIDLHGGKKQLLNRQEAITPEKFTLFRNMHNPC